MQITTLVTSWEWSADDHILHFLPLHHVHGFVNKLCCGVWAGATVEFLPFDGGEVWRRFAAGQGGTVFMAVPTIYRSVALGAVFGSVCVWRAVYCATWLR